MFSLNKNLIKKSDDNINSTDFSWLLAVILPFGLEQTVNQIISLLVNYYEAVNVY
jgi:hypothetical protein